MIIIRAITIVLDGEAGSAQEEAFSVLPTSVIRVSFYRSFHVSGTCPHGVGVSLGGVVMAFDSPNVVTGRTLQPAVIVTAAETGRLGDCPPVLGGEGAPGDATGCGQ